jgi:hypothetical protein
VWSILWASNDEFDNNKPRRREWDDGEWIDDPDYYCGDELEFDGGWDWEWYLDNGGCVNFLVAWDWECCRFEYNNIDSNSAEEWDFKSNIDIGFIVHSFDEYDIKPDSSGIFIDTKPDSEPISRSFVNLYVNDLLPTYLLFHTILKVVLDNNISVTLLLPHRQR